MTWPAPVTLAGDHMQLTPLEPSHAPALGAAGEGLDALWYTTVPNAATMADDIAPKLATPHLTAFCVQTPDGAPVGVTTYLHCVEKDRRVEIGNTWISKSVQRTPLNTEMKFLLLTHAFETLECLRVELRTHRMNRQSRAAIERLGAQLEGILRRHMIMPNGTIRDTAVYAILDTEWDSVRAHLRHKLGHRS